MTASAPTWKASFRTLPPANCRENRAKKGPDMIMHPRPQPASEVTFLRRLRRLSDPMSASVEDMVEVVNMARGGDLRHIDEACEAFSAADHREGLDLFEIMEGLPGEIAFSVRAEAQEELRPGWHNVPSAHDVTVRSVTVAAVRMGDWHGTRDDLIAMIGDERVRQIEEMQMEDCE